MKREYEPKGLQEILKKMIEETPLEAGIDNVKAQEIWRKSMGGSVQAYTESVDLKKNTLYVRLTSSVLRQELSYGLEAIRNQMNENFGKEVVKKIILL